MPATKRALSDDLHELIDPLIVREWHTFYVATADGPKRVTGGVAMITPEQIHAEIVDRIPLEAIEVGCRILSCDNSSVVLAGAGRIDCDAVYDLRQSTGAQMVPQRRLKLVVRDYQLDESHGLHFPVLLDATLTAPPFYSRFLQYLPLGERILRVISASPVGEVSVTQQSRGFRGKGLISEQVFELAVQKEMYRDVAEGRGYPILPPYLGSQLIAAAAIAQSIVIEYDRHAGSPWKSRLRF